MIANDQGGEPDFLGFTDLEADLLGPRGKETAEETLMRLAALDERLERATAASLSPGDHATVEALRGAVRAGATILTNARR